MSTASHHEVRVHPVSSRAALAPFVASAALAVAFLAVTVPVLDTLFWDYDEGWFMLGARFVARGERPFLDFIHHQPPLHLYLLALFGKAFGQTLEGYRLLSAASIAVAGMLLFRLAKPFSGPVAALVAQAVFYFSAPQIYALCALPEPPTGVFMLLGAVLLFTGEGRLSTYASGVAFTLGLLTKPTSGVMVLAAALSVLYARDWRRLADLALSGGVASAAGLLWLLWVSDGGFADVLGVQIDRAWTRTAGMWSVDSGFTDMLRLEGIDSRLQWALICFRNFFKFPETLLPMALFALSFAGMPVWLARLARPRSALQAFVVLWPLSYFALNFWLLDFVAEEKFTSFLAFSALWLAGVVWLVQQRLPARPAVAAAAVLCIGLGAQFHTKLGGALDPWYYERARVLVREHPHVVSFTPMLFAATGTEPGCGFWNPINTYGRFGEAVGTDRTRELRFYDEDLVACLEAHPEMSAIVDWGFYFFTRRGGPLRDYLDGEARARRVFLSEDAEEQWDEPLLSMDMDR